MHVHANESDDPSGMHKTWSKKCNDARFLSFCSSLLQMTKLALHAHQQQAVNRILQPHTRGLLLFFAVGAGKTLTSISAAEQLMKTDKALRTLVVCPAALIINFQNEMQKAGVVAQDKYELLSYHAFTKRFRSADEQQTLSRTLLIFDEAHNLRNFTTALSQVALRVAEKVPKVVLLTGTPVQNRPADISPLLNMLQPRCLPVSQDAFEERFGEDGLSQHRDQMKRAVRGKIAHHGPEDSDSAYPTITTRDVFVTLYPQQVQAHRQAVKGLPIKTFDDLDSRNLLSFLSGPRKISNAIRAEGRVYAAKLEVIVDRVSKAAADRKKSIVYSCFLEYGVDIIQQMLAEKGVKTALITGAQDRDSKEKARLAYNQRKVMVLLFSKAGGEGLSLTDTSFVHLTEPAWNDSNVQQVIGRSRRLGSHSGRFGTHITVYRYIAVLPPEVSVASKARKLWRQIGVPSVLNTRTADQILYDMAQKKEQINSRFLQFCIKYGKS